MKIKSDHAGAAWLREFFDGASRRGLQPPSALGADVADLLGVVFGGLYHLRERVLVKVDWHDERSIAVVVPDGLATFDGSTLTALVVIAHDACLRLEVSAPRRSTLELRFWRRARDGGVSKRHPRLEEHVASIRQGYFAHVGWLCCALRENAHDFVG